MAAATLIGDGYLRKLNFIAVVLVGFAFFWHVVSEDDSIKLSVMEGDSVVLHTDTEIKSQNKMKWYFTDSLIGQINSSNHCTDVQCNEDSESFRDRLELDPQTGSLTIRNIKSTDSGPYHLKIIGHMDSSSAAAKTFKITVHNVSAAKYEDVNKSMSVKEGDPVNIDSLLEENKADSLKWYFNGSLVAVKNGDERFTDRLKLDFQTGFLTIMNSRTTDSGNYTMINSRNSFTIIRTFFVKVTDPGLSKVSIAVITIFGGLFTVVACVYGYFYCKNECEKKSNKEEPDEVAEEERETMNLENRRGSEQESLITLNTNLQK